MNSEQNSLKFTFYGHASVLISYENFSVLTDPWFKNHGNGAAFSSYPPAKVPTVDEISKITALQISHNHSDHFCPLTLSVFPKDIQIFICRTANRTFFHQIKALGFTNITEITPGIDGVTYGPFQLYQFPLPGSPAFDSALVVKANSQFYYLNNDCMFGFRLYNLLKAAFGKFQGCFLGYGPFGPYPLVYDLRNCRDLIKPPTPAEMLNVLQHVHWEHVTEICNSLEPDWVVPYACGARFLTEDTFALNKMFPEPYDIEKIQMETKPVIMWPEDELSAAGVLKSKQPENARRSSQPPKSLCTAPSLKLLPQSLVVDSYKLFNEGLKSYLKNESKHWITKTHIKFNIITQEKPVSFGFYFDGKECLEHDTSATDFDMEIDYPACLLHDVMTGKDEIRHIHYSYSEYFKVKIYRLIFGQQEVHSWGKNWSN